MVCRMQWEEDHDSEMTMSVVASEQQAGLDGLRALSMFKDCADEDLASLRPALVHYPTRRHIYRQGDPYTTVYVLHEGGVKLERREGAGPPQVVSIVEPPAMFGETGLLAGLVYPVSAITFRASQLVAIDADGYVTWLRARPELYEPVIGELGRSVEQLLSDSYVRATLNAEQRVATYLLSRCQAAQGAGVVVDRALSRRDIANLLGLAPETLSRVLHAFRERHWIAVDHGCISVRSNRSLAGLLP